MKLYKYRSFDDLRFLLDIFLNNRLYAAEYTQMNDPMEGHYLVKPEVINARTKALIKNEKDTVRIVSLSTDSDNQLMWSHYADGHNGLAIEVEIRDEFSELKKVNYQGLSELTHFAERDPLETAKHILTHKHEFWSYENEFRVLIRHKKFVSVVITKVIFGCQVSDDDKRFYSELLLKLTPNLKFESAVKQFT
ncbi:DUF2971 domain-containing protein [Aliivibrio fischeri]|uniref:DUF2971 domain-containing protein n=1 Tax=Aliivibrio fischeri TaxID=668 RepID=A0A844P8R3_ALIFS|nr:DUF2971 domain-containing protein [Aliivibrio fischeri]MUK51507.1 DUF2971 domain-containing protein [Aliivibrio fischeri]